MTHYTTLIDVATLAALDPASYLLFDCRFELGNAGWGESEFVRRICPAPNTCTSIAIFPDP